VKIETTLDAKTLAAEAVLAARLLSGKATLPILNCVKLEGKPKSLTITAYDTEIAYEKTIAAKHRGKNWATCVDAKALQDLLKGMAKGGPVTLSPTDKGLSITQGSLSLMLHTLPAEEYPSTPEMSDVRSFLLNSVELGAAMSEAVPFASRDETRAVLTGILLEQMENNAATRVVATDSYRMSLRKIATLDAGPFRIIIPARVAKVFGKMLAAEETDPAGLALYFNAKHAFMVLASGAKITTRLIEGTYPSIERLVDSCAPAFSKVKITTESSTLAAAVNRLKLVAKSEAGKIVFTFTPEGLHLATTSADLGTAAVDVPAAVKHASRKKADSISEFAYNADYLLDALAAIGEGKEVVWDLVGTLGPSTMTSPEAPGLTAITMPMQV
jgi:DNA polymerase III subunit beta